MAKKKMTIEDLAQNAQREFTAIRSEMATKEEMRGAKEDLRETKQAILRAIDGLELKISSYASSWNRDFERLHKWVADHETRVEYLEKKIGARK